MNNNPNHKGWQFLTVLCLAVLVIFTLSAQNRPENKPKETKVVIVPNKGFGTVERLNEPTKPLLGQRGER